MAAETGPGLLWGPKPDLKNPRAATLAGVLLFSSELFIRRLFGRGVRSQFRETRVGAGHGSRPDSSGPAVAERGISQFSIACGHEPRWCRYPTPTTHPPPPTKEGSRHAYRRSHFRGLDRRLHRREPACLSSSGHPQGDGGSLKHPFRGGWLVSRGDSRIERESACLPARETTRLPGRVVSFWRFGAGIVMPEDC